MVESFKIKLGIKVRLADFDSGSRGSLSKSAGLEKTAADVAALDDLSYRLYAEQRRALLLVLQGMDTAGKDGTIRHVFSGVSPQSCRVANFKQPSHEELSHDFLWRAHKATPPRGEVGIFNRSHYEDVLVVRVHKFTPKSIWKNRYDQINDFEQMLVAEGTTIVKVFLHISREEQLKRLLARQASRNKCWKLSEADVKERKLWDDYVAAYEDVITRCNTAEAPWHIVPADHKWYRNFAVSRILREALKKMNPKFPAPLTDVSELKIR
jgi:PPK2 family polyphosphate:nucleotide phosphotransferase